MRASTKIVLGLFVTVTFANLILAQSEVEYEVDKFLGARSDRSKPSKPKYTPSAVSQGDYEDYDTYVLSIQWGSKLIHF